VVGTPGPGDAASRSRNEEGTSPLDRARVITEQARHLITRGEPAQAERALQQALQQAHQLFTTAGAEDEAATVMGIIADIAYDRGELDEALRIRREIELPAFERLGDTRETAVTWGKIADIAYRRGELGEAAELQHKRLEVNKQLGDLDGIAAATWDLPRSTSPGRITNQPSPEPLRQIPPRTPRPDRAEHSVDHQPVIVPPMPLPRMTRQQRLQLHPLRITEIMPLQPVITHGAIQAEMIREGLRDTA
jgi:hypothetical protein